MNHLSDSIRKKYNLILFISLLILLILSIGLAVSFGSMDLPVKDVYKVIISKLFNVKFEIDYSELPIHDVVWLIRLPRLLLACAVGMGLSLSGVVMQAVIKNPLADPYILGISSGAYLGAVIAIILGVGKFLGDNYIGASAFIGAFLVSLLVLGVSNIGGRSNSMKLLLSGMAISAACSAVSNFIVYTSNDKDALRSVSYWMMGSFGGAKWSSLKVIYILIISGIVFFISQYRILDLMLLGDDVAITLGTDLNKYRTKFLLVVSLIVGFIVYSSGMIGFVGLLVPHFVRIIVGTSHKALIPISALVGGIFLIWADVFARTIIPHTDIPIGILISMIGSPIFIYLLVKKAFLQEGM